MIHWICFYKSNMDSCITVLAGVKKSDNAVVFVKATLTVAE